MKRIFSNIARGMTFDPEHHFIEGEDRDKAFLKYATIVDICKTRYPSTAVVLVSHNATNYLFIQSKGGPSQPICGTAGFSETDLTPGMIALVLFELDSQRVAGVSKDLIEERVFFNAPTEDSPTSHEAILIASFFYGIQGFVLEAGVEPRIADAMITLSLANAEIVSPLLQKRHINLIGTCVQAPNRRVREVVSQALWIQDYTQVFLKFYQLLEMLYPLPYIQVVHSTIAPSGHNVVQLLKAITTHLGWRYVENQAIENLLRRIPMEDFVQLTGFDELSASNDCYTKASNVIYLIRCNLVHLKLDQEEIAIESGQWQDLLYYLLNYVAKLHEKYQTILLQSDSPGAREPENVAMSLPMHGLV